MLSQRHPDPKNVTSLFESSKNFNKEDWFGERSSGKPLNMSILQQEYTKEEKETANDNQTVDPK